MGMYSRNNYSNNAEIAELLENEGFCFAGISKVEEND